MFSNFILNILTILTIIPYLFKWGFNLAQLSFAINLLRKMERIIINFSA